MLLGPGLFVQVRAVCDGSEKFHCLEFDAELDC